MNTRRNVSKLLLATTNLGKIKEFCSLFEQIPFQITTPDKEQIILDVEESGSTFSENAYIKAIAYMKESGIISLADDSGIEVDALGGKPGIYSARYGGKSLNDKDRVELLLKNMEGVPWEKRTARFRASIVIAWPDGKAILKEGVFEGYIGYKPKGVNGFGYDPIFFLPQFGMTSAQLTKEKKNKISHRSIASKKILDHLQREYNKSEIK